VEVETLDVDVDVKRRIAPITISRMLPPKVLSTS
jgi:hypothetical protein